MSGHGKTGSSMPEGEEVERQDPRQVKAYCQASGSSQRPKYVLVVHLLGHNFFQYGVLIHVTQIMSFVCKQTVRTVVCIKNLGK